MLHHSSPKTPNVFLGEGVGVRIDWSKIPLWCCKGPEVFFIWDRKNWVLRTLLKNTTQRKPFDLAALYRLWWLFHINAIFQSETIYNTYIYITIDHKEQPVLGFCLSLYFFYLLQKSKWVANVHDKEQRILRSTRGSQP